MRNAEITRKTAETAITVAVDLDGTGRYDDRTPASVSSTTCSTSWPAIR